MRVTVGKKPHMWSFARTHQVDTLTVRLVPTSFEFNEVFHSILPFSTYILTKCKANNNL
ncbi:hypothetical protein LPIBR_60014 [Lacticaseibacillus paracasei]|nr:hypothetical protein LPIBR_60014 [Lacticaseibacillus paracasei]